MTKQEGAAAHARMTNELAYLRAFHAAAYALAGPRPEVRQDEPDWPADLFEVERRAVASLA